MWTKPSELVLDPINQIIAEASMCKGTVLIGAPPPSACSGKTSRKKAPEYKKWCPREEGDPACIHERLYRNKANALYKYMNNAARILNCPRMTIVDMMGDVSCDETRFRSLFEDNDIHFRPNLAEDIVKRVVSSL